MAQGLTSKPVCIVEDDEAVRDSLAELLRSHGFEVQSYASALAFLGDRGQEHTDCACLIADLHMPGMNGLELVELLRKRRSTTPVVVITGRADSGLRERARRSDAIALLDKPVDEDALLRAIARAFQKSLENVIVTLKIIRLELARSAAHPQGDPGHGYVFRAPLDEFGHIDVRNWEKHRDLCVVHRLEGGRDVETGVLRRTGPGRWVFSYEPGDDDDEPVFRMSQHAFTPGQYVSITEHDGVERTFRVISVEDWHPQASQARPERNGSGAGSRKVH
jgi:CheY-like chemotaxis protein